MRSERKYYAGSSSRSGIGDGKEQNYLKKKINSRRKGKDEKKKKEKIGQIICSWYEVLFFEKAGAGTCPTGAVGLAVGGGQGVDVDSRRELGERWEHTFLSVTFPFLR